MDDGFLLHLLCCLPSYKSKALCSVRHGSSELFGFCKTKHAQSSQVFKLPEVEMRILNLAPHLSLPAKDGADLRTWNLAQELAGMGNQVYLLSRFFPATPTHALNNFFTKSSALEQLTSVIQALIAGKCYWQSKMLTRDTWDFVNRVKANDYEAVIVNFLYSAPLLRLLQGHGTRVIVETHNCDEEYFGRMAAASTNPLVRQLCRRAAKVSLAGLWALPKGIAMSHVSKHDAAYYDARRADLKHAVVPNACTPKVRKVSPPYEDTGRRELVFVASLSSTMNQDALATFASDFWPKLADFCNLTVAGSNPTRAIRGLCREKGWNLRPNISEEELMHLYERTHFALLPFAYAAGSKLKLFEAVGRGVPVVATAAGANGLEVLPQNVFVSDSPEEWARHVRTATQFDQPTPSTLYAWSWRSSAEQMESLLSKLSPITL